MRNKSGTNTSRHTVESTLIVIATGICSSILWLPLTVYTPETWHIELLKYGPYYFYRDGCPPNNVTTIANH